MRRPSGGQIDLGRADARRLGGNTAPDARRVLANERAKFLDALEDIPGAYVATNLRGVIVDANRRASSLLGERRLVDKELVGFVVRRDAGCFRRALDDLAKQERRESVISLHLRERRGLVINALLSARVVYGLGRQPVALRWLIFGDAPRTEDTRSARVAAAPLRESPP